MNTYSKLALALSVCITATACTTTTTPLAKERSLQTKIDTVYLNQLNHNIAIELSDTTADSDTQNAFKKILESTTVMDANKVLVNALEHNLEGYSIGEDVIIRSSVNLNNNASDQTPVLTPTVTMSSDYGTINVLLTAISGAKKKTVYSSKQTIKSTNLSGSKEASKQFWLDNPIVLREKILDGLYDVAKQFSNNSN